MHGFLMGLFVVTGIVWAAEEAVPRSSHPRGIAADGRPPATVAPAGEASQNRSASVSTPAAAPSASAPGGRQTTSEGVNLSGATRIDARAREASAAAVGQGNAAGNRVGTIGGK